MSISWQTFFWEQRDSTHGSGAMKDFILKKILIVLATSTLFLQVATFGVADVIHYDTEDCQFSNPQSSQANPVYHVRLGGGWGYAAWGVDVNNPNPEVYADSIRWLPINSHAVWAYINPDGMSTVWLGLLGGGREQGAQFEPGTGIDSIDFNVNFEYGISELGSSSFGEWVVFTPFTITITDTPDSLIRGFPPTLPSAYMTSDDGTQYFAQIFLNGPDVGIQISPVPEPTTMVLLASGLIGLAAYGRRKFLKK
jgi:hypothetical protein